MKKLAIILILFICVATVNNAHAQLSKEETKEWKKKLKKMSPEQLKRMYDENSSLKSELSSVQGQLSSIQARLSEKDAKIAEMTQQLREAEAKVNNAQRAIAQAQEQTQAQTGSGRSTISEDGVVFKVQIGAFRNKDLSKYFENHENFGGEMGDDGIQKITLGIFRDYWEADTFKKYLREMGVNDAWIVPYKDGVRVEMKDVLEGVI